MGKARQLCVFRIDYEKIPSMSMWTAFIAAYSHEEAIAFLLRKVGPYHATTSGLHCRVDAFDDSVLEDIYNAVKSRKVSPAADDVAKVADDMGTETHPPEFTDEISEKKKAALKRK